MALLTRVEILKKNDRKHLTVEVAEWGGEVRILGFGAETREMVENKFGADAKNNLLRPWLLSISLVNEVDELLFSEADVKELGKKSETPICRLFDTILEFNGMSKKGKEELEKNSETTGSESLPIASPPSTDA